MKQDISLDSVLKLYVFVNLKRNQYKTFDVLNRGLKKNAIKNKTKLGCQKQRQA
jgi:hypothetical protein